MKIMLMILQMELQYKYPKLDLKVLIGSVRDKKRLRECL